jgi:hypothetical protein
MSYDDYDIPGIRRRKSARRDGEVCRIRSARLHIDRKNGARWRSQEQERKECER